MLNWYRYLSEKLSCIGSYQSLWLSILKRATSSMPPVNRHTAQRFLTKIVELYG